MLCITSALVPADEQGWPDPLTLEHALQIGQEGNPEILLSKARQSAAQARLQQAESRYGTRISLLAQARAVDPSPMGRTLFDGHDDSAVRLEVQRRLYDFGHTRALVAAADAAHSGQGHSLDQLRLERRWEVMSRYLEVLLADLKVQAEEEAMVSAYVPVDRGRTLLEQGRLSEVDFLGLDTRYQRLRAQIHEARGEQRRSRSRLALALNRPGTAPTRLQRPEFPGNLRPVPELAELESQALNQNPGLLSLQARKAAARKSLAAARAGNRPVLRGLLAASDYRRQGGSDDDLEAELALEIPLSTGGKVAADAALAHAKVVELSAQVQQMEWTLRQELYDLTQDLQVLQEQYRGMESESAFRDMALDRSRVLYEMEVKSDLGDAMARFSELRLYAAQIEFDLALAWARLAVLTANPQWEPLPVTARPQP